MLNEDVVKNINKLDKEQGNINIELSKKASKEDLEKVIQNGTNVAVSKDISTSNWTLEENTYTTIIEHNLVTRKVLISLIDKTTNNNVFCSYKILDDNRIKVFNETNDELECIVVNGNSAINMTSATIDDNRSTEATTYSSIKIEALLKVLENKIDDIENLKEVDNIRCTTDTGEYTIENSKKGYLTSFNIQGKTLVNLASTNIFTLENNSTKEGNFIKLNNSASYVNLTSRLNTGIYTLIVNVADINVSYTIHTILSGGGNKEVFTKAGNQVLKLNMDNKIDKLRVYTTDSSNALKIQMVLLEGDYTSKNISYFEGLQSVGQGDNIELFSCKKDINIIPNNITWKDGYFLSRNDNLEYESEHYSYTLDYIPVKANTNYTLIYANWNILLYDKDKNKINFTDSNPFININGLGDKISEGLFFIETTSNSCYMRISVPTRYKDRITISEGVKFDKKIIPYTLRSLPNGIKDEIVYKNNKYYLIKRCEEHTYTDIGNLDLAYTYDNTLLFMGILNPPAIVDSLDIPYVLCNNFKGKSGNDLNNEDNDGCSTNSAAAISFKILKSKLSTLDKNGFNEWIKNNPITIIYQLVEPEEIELTTLNLEQYDSQTKFICNTGTVIPNISFEITQNLGSHIEVIRNNIKELISTQGNANTINLDNKLLNGWTLFSDIHRKLAFSKNGNIITIIGSIKGGTTSNETVICKIPDDMIPKSNQLFQVFNTIGTSVGLLYVNSYGDFKVNSLASNISVIINAQYILD